MNASQIIDAAVAITCDAKACATLQAHQVAYLTEITLGMNASEARIVELWNAARIDAVKLDQLKAIVNR